MWLWYQEGTAQDEGGGSHHFGCDTISLYQCSIYEVLVIFRF